MANIEVSVIKLGDLTILYQKCANNQLPPTLDNILETSDLKPGVYEGGFKIWECSIDLCRFMVESEYGRFDGKRVIELGCGAGLPGIVAMKQGSSHTCFQDFNEEVITMWTKGNVDLNRQDYVPGADFSFLIGDWDEIKRRSVEYNRSFDVVLSSETIYNCVNYGKLLDTIDAALASDGIALIAAKAYYFGVGGSVVGFMEFVDNDKRFNGRILWTSKNTGINRHILLLRRC